MIVPEDGYAYIANCHKCDHPTLKYYFNGLHRYYDPVSIPLKDARVLARYWDVVLNVWPDPWTSAGKPNSKSHPVRFLATAWSPPSPPSMGRLYVRHICRMRRRKALYDSSHCGASRLAGAAPRRAED